MLISESRRENRIINGALQGCSGADGAQSNFAADCCPDVLWSYSIEQEAWQYISPSIEKLSGYRVDEALQLPLDRLLTPESFSRFSEQLEARLKEFAEDRGNPQVYRDELEISRKDGTTVWCEVNSHCICNENQALILVGVVRDITERMELLKQLEYFSMHDQMTGLYNRTYFEEEMRRFSNARDYPITMIAADLNGLKLINDSLGHDFGDRLLQAAASVLQDSLRGPDVLARVGGDEFCAILLNTDERVARRVINRIRSNVKKFCDDHPDLHLSLSLGSATALDDSTSFSELFKRADDAMYNDKYAPTTTMRNKILKSLMNILSEKDYIKEGHAKRLAQLCRRMGEKLSLSPRQQADLALLAQVHDLGKVGIPDTIIFKEGPLSDDEWRIMKQHPEKGHRIALSSNYLTAVASLILKHHERWDGQGYPLGLKGLEIPLECRIFAIADAYDAMTNARPYRMARSKEEALHEIEQSSAQQFDPDLVAPFIEVVKKAGLD